MNDSLNSYSKQELEVLLQAERAAFLNALDQNADLEELQRIKLKIQQIWLTIAAQEDRSAGK